MPPPPPPSTSPPAPASTLSPRLVAFGESLRGHGLNVGTTELIDAGRATTIVGFEDRERLRAAIAATLLRRSGNRQLFDDLFDIYFPTAVGESAALPHAGDAPNRRTPAWFARDATERRQIAGELRDRLAAALAAGDEAALQALAAQVTATLGRLPNQATLGSFSAAQAIDALNPRAAIALAESLAQQGSPNRGAGSAGGGSGMAAGFSRDELRAEVAAFRRRIETETRRRNAEIRGTERIALYAVRSPTEQTSFVLAGPDELAELRRAITPLARKLATRLAARRRLGRGAPIDIRRTLRRSMATGGVPMRPAYQRHTRSRVDLVLLCDMSSSVAGFSRFTIMLVQALAATFRRVRVFGFVNVVDELTEVVTRAAPGADLTHAFDDVARMTKWHKNSDYGTALADFAEHHLDAVGHRTVVLILGDARTNHTNPGLAALHAINERAKAVIWLNPEPARQWDSGDSVAHRYAEIVDMHECRNLAQLRHFVARLLPV